MKLKTFYLFYYFPILRCIFYNVLGPGKIEYIDLYHLAFNVEMLDKIQLTLKYYYFSGTRKLSKIVFNMETKMDKLDNI